MGRPDQYLSIKKSDLHFDQTRGLPFLVLQGLGRMVPLSLKGFDKKKRLLNQREKLQTLSLASSSRIFQNC